jgi:hypothetical protein
MNKADLERALKKTTGAALKRVVVEILRPGSPYEYKDIASVERRGDVVIIVLQNQAEVDSDVAS